jgi:hypothetical protein
MCKALLIDFRDTYARSWLKSILNIALIIIAGPLIAGLIFDDPITPRLFLGSALVAAGAFAVRLWAKQRYPISLEGENTPESCKGEQT